MRRGITRAEMIILILVLIVAISPLLAEGGFARLLFESIDTSGCGPRNHGDSKTRNGNSDDLWARIHTETQAIRRMR